MCHLFVFLTAVALAAVTCRQTRTSTLTAREILSQKIVGMKRLMIVLSIPILSIHLTLLLLSVDPKTLLLRSSMQTISMVAWYSVSCVLTTFLTMQIIAWLSVLLGLRSTSQSKSAMTAISLIAAWVLVSAFFFRPAGFVHEVLRLTGQSITSHFSQPSDLMGRTILQERIDTGVAGVCCMARPDGGVQANEAVLTAIGNPYVEATELYFAPSRSYISAIGVSAVVFGWQMLLLLLIRSLTLRLAPTLLQRKDQISVLKSAEQQDPWPAVARGSEVLA